MKTTKNIDTWIANVLQKELNQVPGMVIESAKRLNRLDLIADQISRKTGINSNTVITYMTKTAK